MDTPVHQWTIPEGTDVVGADGHKVGKVVASQDAFIVVEKGFFFPSDYYIPTTAIANFDGDTVYLNVTKDDALHQDWAQQPQGWQQAPDETAYQTETGEFSNAVGRLGETRAGEGDPLVGIEPTGIGERTVPTQADPSLLGPETDRGHSVNS